ERHAAPLEQQRHRRGVHARDAGEIDGEAGREVRAGGVLLALGEHRREALEVERPREAQHLGGAAVVHLPAALAGGAGGAALRSRSVFTSPSMPPFWIWSLNEP